MADADSDPDWAPGSDGPDSGDEQKAKRRRKSQLGRGKNALTTGPATGVHTPKQAAVGANAIAQALLAPGESKASAPGIGEMQVGRLAAMIGESPITANASDSEGSDEGWQSSIEDEHGHRHSSYEDELDAASHSDATRPALSPPSVAKLSDESFRLFAAAATDECFAAVIAACAHIHARFAQAEIDASHSSDCDGDDAIFQRRQLQVHNVAQQFATQAATADGFKCADAKKIIFKVFASEEEIASNFYDHVKLAFGQRTLNIRPRGTPASDGEMCAHTLFTGIYGAGECCQRYVTVVSRTDGSCSLCAATTKARTHAAALVSNGANPIDAAATAHQQLTTSEQRQLQDYAVQPGDQPTSELQVENGQPDQNHHMASRMRFVRSMDDAIANGHYDDLRATPGSFIDTPDSKRLAIFSTINELSNRDPHDGSPLSREEECFDTTVYSFARIVAHESGSGELMAVVNAAVNHGLQTGPHHVIDGTPATPDEQSERNRLRPRTVKIGVAKLAKAATESLPYKDATPEEWAEAHKATKKWLLMQDTPTADSLCRNGAKQYLREIPRLLRPLFSFVLKSTSKGRPRDRGLRARIHVAGTGNGQMVVYESTAQSLLALALAGALGRTPVLPFSLLELADLQAAEDKRASQVEATAAKAAAAAARAQVRAEDQRRKKRAKAAAAEAAASRKAKRAADKAAAKAAAAAEKVAAKAAAARAKQTAATARKQATEEAAAARTQQLAVEAAQLESATAAKAAAEKKAAAAAQQKASDMLAATLGVGALAEGFVPPSSPPAPPAGQSIARRTGMSRQLADGICAAASRGKVGAADIDELLARQRDCGRHAYTRIATALTKHQGAAFLAWIAGDSPKQAGHGSIAVPQALLRKRRPGPFRDVRHCGRTSSRPRHAGAHGQGGLQRLRPRHRQGFRRVARRLHRPRRRRGRGVQGGQRPVGWRRPVSHGRQRGGWYSAAHSAASGHAARFGSRRHGGDAAARRLRRPFRGARRASGQHQPAGARGPLPRRRRRLQLGRVLAVHHHGPQGGQPAPRAQGRPAPRARRGPATSAIGACGDAAALGAII